MKKTLSFFWVLSLFTFHVSAQGIDFVDNKNFSEVLEMAKKQNKIIFMDCYTTWCGPCKRLAAMVFPDPEVGGFFNATFINTKFDMEKGEGPEISGRYGIRAYPTLLWLDGDGNVVHKVVGGLDVLGLIQNGKKAIDSTPGMLAGMRKMYAEGNRDLLFLNDFVNTLQLSGEKVDEVFKEYLGKLSDGQLRDEKHAKTIFGVTNDIASPGITYLTKSKSYYIQLVGEEVFNKKINQVTTKAVSDAVETKNVELFNTAMDLLKDNKASDYAEKILELSMTYYSRTNDWDNYDKNATSYIKKYASKNTEVLNEVAWNYFLNMNETTQLQKAAKWAYDAVNTNNKYTYNITYAYLLYKLRDYKEAEKACDYAIIKAQEENVLPSSATALKDAIKKELGR